MDAIRLLGTKVTSNATSKTSPTRRIAGTTLGPSGARGGVQGPTSPRAPKKGRSAPASAVSAEEAQLFEDAMAGLDAGTGAAAGGPVKAAVAPPSAPAAPAAPFELGIRVEAELDADAFAAALDGREPEAPPEPSPVPKAAPPTPPPSVINDKRFRALLDKGRMRVASDLDLHGLTLVAAHDAVRAFIADSLQDGVKVVRIVHGKGMHSRGEPVLRDSVRRLLRHDLEDDVLAMATPPERMGGDGATVCLLRTPEPAQGS